jgi:dienelactone hydrolase
MIFSSCQKDVIKEEGSLSNEVASDANAADALSETAPPVYTSVVTNVNSNVAGFWQAVPARYNTTTKRYPLIIFIHGIGELGTSLSRMNCCGLPYHLKTQTFPPEFVVNGVRYSFIVMAPQFKWRPSAADVQSVIDYAKRRFRVDDTRVYVTGLSMGGGSTWDYSAVYGQNAAAIVPVCGGTKPTTTLAQRIAGKNLPIWGLYSSSDAVVPVSWGYDFFRWIDQYNTGFASKTKLTVWSGVTHNSTWGKAFNPATKVDGYNIYQWMLLHRRTTAPTSPAPAPAPTPTPSPTPSPTPTTGNKVPVANSQPNMTVPYSWRWFPTLNGNFSKDPDGWITRYSWTKISGPACTITPIIAGRARVTGWTKGVYVFRVTVRDNKGATDTHDLTINITNN